MSSQFATRLDSILPPAINAIMQGEGDVSGIVPGLSKKAIADSISEVRSILAYIDRSPDFDRAMLAYGGSNIADQIISWISNIPSYTQTGFVSFVQSYLPQFVDLKIRIELVTGGRYSAQYTAQGARNRIKSLDQRLGSAEKIHSEIESLRNQILKIRSDSEENLTKSVDNNTVMSEKTAELQHLLSEAQSIVSGENETEEDVGEPKSITSVFDQATKNLKEIEEIKISISDSQLSVGQTKTYHDEVRVSIDALLGESQRISTESKKLLQGATQAGLAGSFISEKESRKMPLVIYLCLFFGLLVATTCYGLFSFIPHFEELMQQLAAKKVSDTAFLAMMIARIALFAPLAIAIAFCASQFRKLDLIRNDYSAKMAATLAYEGYKKDVATDEELLTDLRRALINRFSEHPLRLIVKVPEAQKDSILDRNLKRMLPKSENEGS